MRLALNIGIAFVVEHTLPGYRRTELVLCPDPKFFGVRDVFGHILKMLTESSSHEPTEEEMLLFNKLIRLTDEEEDQEPFHRGIVALASVALRWKNADLWLKVFHLPIESTRLRELGAENVMNSCRILGIQRLGHELRALLLPEEYVLTSRNFPG